MPTQDEAMQALDAIDSQLQDDGAMSAQGLEDVCDKYRGIRDDLEKAVAFLESLPLKQTKAIAKAIRMLMVIADLACPIDN